MVFDNFFSYIEDFSFYILSLVFTFDFFQNEKRGKKISRKKFRVSEGWLVY